MKAKFHIIKRIVDMEHPKNNNKDEYIISVEEDELFEKDNEGNSVFKLISLSKRSAEIEYNRHYAVRNEHKGYEFTTTFELGETKEIMSMWGKEQITYKITYQGIDEKTLQEAIESNPAESYTDSNKESKEEYNNLDDVVNHQDQDLNEYDNKQSTIF
jgi:hypothetical protein